VATHLIAGDSAILLPEQAHHLRNVLRLSAGDAVELFDGEGHRYSGVVEQLGPEVRIGRIVKHHSIGGPPPQLVVAAGLIKQDRFEWMLEKATELGVDEFVLLTTRRSNIRIPEDRLVARLQRWHRITREAARQCGRTGVPTIRRPIDAAAFFGMESASACAKFFFLEGAGEQLAPRLGGCRRAILCIGPEGGWDTDEVAAARQAGFEVCGLGSRMLRAETAALAAVAVFQFLLAGHAPGLAPAADPGPV